MDAKLIIFDKDGTLLDFDAFWLPVTEAALGDIISAAKVSDGAYLDILKEFGVENGITDIESELCKGTYASMGSVIYSVLKKYGTALSENEVIKMTRDAYHKYMDKGIMRPNCEGLFDSLSSLRSSGITLAVVTTDAPLVTEACLKALGIRELFSYVLSDDGVMPTKPSPAGVRFLENELSLSKEEILMVGDTMTDVCFAKASGIKVVGVAKTEKNKETLVLGGADTVVRDVSYVQEALALL